ncbi:MAG: hypothetical protein KAR33_03085 [Candidatus Thorarchaeota archaeon]|nr:hypothetical protein [Candidatus Thorarchaeota archaeon]
MDTSAYAGVSEGELHLLIKPVTLASILNLLEHLIGQIGNASKEIEYMRTGTSYAVLGLAIIGLTLLSTISIPITTENVVISTAFTVDPGMTYGPYEDDTIYHTMIFGSSVLRGEIIIEGEGIYLTVNGEHTQNLEGVLINNRFEFEVVPAIDQYTFEFNNTNGVIACMVQFTLVEVWTRPVAMSATTIWGMWLGGVLIFMVGFLGLIVVRLRSHLAKTPTSNERNELLSIWI